MALSPATRHSHFAINRTTARRQPTSLLAQARDAALRVPGVTAALDWLDQHEKPSHALRALIVNNWWDCADRALRQPFDWVVSRARLHVQAYLWDLSGLADRLLTWACALEALANFHRALRNHPDVPEENGVVEHLENQALILRAVATAYRARFQHSQAHNTHDPAPTRHPAAPEIETLVGAHLDQLSNPSTTRDERIAILAQIKVLLTPAFGAAVQVLHDVS